MKNEIRIRGQHKRLDLAEKALARHIKKYKAESGEIISRRDSKGRYSGRGRSFLFSLVINRKSVLTIIGISYPWRKSYFSFVGRKFSQGKLSKKSMSAFKEKVVAKLAAARGQEITMGEDEETVTMEGGRNWGGIINVQETIIDKRKAGEEFEDEFETIKAKQ